MGEYIPYVTAPCPVCNATISKVEGSTLNREIRLHCLRDHREELRARLDNPHDSVIQALEDIEICFRKRDL